MCAYVYSTSKTMCVLYYYLLLLVRFAADVVSDNTSSYELPSIAFKPAAVVVSPLSSHNHNQSSNSHHEASASAPQPIGAIAEKSSADKQSTENDEDEISREESVQSYSWDEHQRPLKPINPLAFINHSDQSVFTMVQHSIRKSYEDQNPSVIIQNNQSRYSLANTAESMSPVQYTQLVSGEVSPSATMIVAAGPITPPSTSPAHYSTLQSAIAGNVHFGTTNQYHHQPNHYHTINISSGNNNNNNNNNIAYVDFNYQLSLDLSHKTAGTDKTGGIDDDDDHSEAGVDEKSINHQQIRSAHNQSHQHHQLNEYQQNKSTIINDDHNDHIVSAKIAANANHHHHPYTNIHTHHHLHTDSGASQHMHLIETHHDNHHHHDLLTNDDDQQHHHHHQHIISPESAALRNGLLGPMYSSAVYTSQATAATESASTSHSPVPISSTSNDDNNGLMHYNYGHTSVLVATGTTTTTSTGKAIDDVINDTLKDEPDHCCLTGGEEQSQYLTLTSVQDIQHLKNQHYQTDHHHHQQQHHTAASTTSSGGDSRGSPSGLSQTDFDQGLQNFTHLTSAVDGGRKLYGSGGEQGLLHAGGTGGSVSAYDISTR